MIDINLYYKIVAYVVAGVVGLCVGSFLNVVIYRVPLGMSVAKPASHCPQCKSPIKWYDNIPVLSYILLGGKCRKCKVHIPFRYTAVELANAVMWLLSVFVFWNSSPLYAAVTALLSTVLICIFFIDLEHMLIFDRFQIMVVALGTAAIFTAKSDYTGLSHWYSHLIGAVCGFGVFYIVGTLGEKILGREALGGGDVKLALGMGLFLGWQKLLLAVLISSLIASAVLIILNRKSGEEGREYPFGPFLAFGFALSAFVGDAIINWYISIL